MEFIINVPVCPLRLPQHVEKLQPKKPGERAPYTSYRYALIELVRSLADPRSGRNRERLSQSRANKMFFGGHVCSRLRIRII
jgi:hypothetical protein